MFDWWYGIAIGPADLAMQSTRVVSLRLGKFASEGLSASAEAQQMFNEKVAAFSDAALKLATGTFPHVVLNDLRAIVNQNVKRLSA